MKGISANGKHSFEEFGLSIAERTISLPQPNSITESVPYQNGEYDFSAINGEVTYKNRDIKYSFSIAELSTEEMEKKKRVFSTWIKSVVNTKIFDDYDPEYYFYGSLKSFSWKEDFGPGTIEVVFSVYPYKYSIEKTTIAFEVDGELETVLNTDSAHQVIPKIITNTEMVIERDNTSIAIGNGTYYDLEFVLYPTNKFKFIGTGTITFEFVKEVI